MRDKLILINSRGMYGLHNHLCMQPMQRSSEEVQFFNINDTHNKSTCNTIFLALLGLNLYSYFCIVNTSYRKLKKTKKKENKHDWMIPYLLIGTGCWFLV